MTTPPPTARNPTPAFAVAGAIEDPAPVPAGRDRRVIRAEARSLVGKRFGAVVAVGGFDLNVERGGVYGYRRPNGAPASRRCSACF